LAKFHGKHVRVYVDGYDISGYTNSLEVEQGADVVDVAAFSSASKEYVVGLFDSIVNHGGFFDDTANEGGHAVLSARLGSATNFMALIGTSPGGHGFAGSAELEAVYSVEASIAGAITHKSKLTNSGTQGIDNTITIVGRGTLAAAGTSTAVATTPSSVAGGRAYIQNFGSYGLASPGSADGLGTVFLIGAADAAFTSGTAIIASFGSQGTAPSASGLAFTGTAQFMKILQGGGLGRPQVAVAVDLN